MTPGIVTRFHTNGTLLDEDKSRRLIDSGLDQFAFSFDGFDAETYEKIRVNAKFEKTVGNIVRFLEIKKEMGAKKPATFIELIHFPDVFKKADRAAAPGFPGPVQGPAPRQGPHQGAPQLGRATPARPATARSPTRPAPSSGTP